MNAIIHASESMQKRLQSGEWLAGDRLPSLSELAKSCAVSRTTMWRAVALLQKGALVYTKKRGGIIAGRPGISRAAPASESGTAWKRVENRIRQELLLKMLSNDSLPPVNKMALQYHVAIGTLKKALTELVRKGLLTRGGCHYYQKRGREHRYQPAIVLISQGDREHGISVPEYRAREVVGAFERECFRTGHISRCEGFSYHNGNSLLDLGAAIKGAKNIAGCILNVWPISNQTYWQRWLDLIRFLLNRDLPVVLIDQGGDCSFPDSLLGNNRFRILRISGVKAGEIVAANLLLQGHERLAYVAPFFVFDWAKNRYAGLCRYFSRHGTPQSGIELFTLDKNIDQLDLLLARLNLGSTDMHALFRERHAPEEIQEMITRMAKLKSTGVLPEFPPDPSAKTIHDLARFLITRNKQPHDPKAHEAIFQTLTHIASNNAKDWFLRPLFKKILEKSNATAWVCFDDNTALSALPFLKKCGKKVPKDISVVGFDNVTPSLEAQLSSFDFNLSGIVQQAILMIMDEKSLKSRPTISEVDGYVVERRTTMGPDFATAASS